MEKVRTYKVFNKDMELKGEKYKVGEIYDFTKDEKCTYPWESYSYKFRFFYTVLDCFKEAMPSIESVSICEINVLGDIVEHTPSDIDGYFTKKFEIVRKLEAEEILELCNDGNGNDGIGNVGNQNKGNYNRGNKNYGHFNEGNYNQGTGNEGNENKGSFNIGDNNIGTGNIGSINFGDDNIGLDNRGNRNVGNHNIGNYNKGDYCLGDFNTQSIGCLTLFNKPVPNSVVKNFRKTKFYKLLDNLGGFNTYNKKYTTNELYLFWWELLSSDEKNEFKSYDFFDHLVFQNITGIEVD